MIHDSSLFISSDLNDNIETIETVNDEKMNTRESDIIDLKIIINDQNINVTMSNVYYCFELDSNLIVVKILKIKNFEFRDLNNRLSIIDNEKDVIL